MQQVDTKINLEDIDRAPIGIPMGVAVDYEIYYTIFADRISQKDEELLDLKRKLHHAEIENNTRSELNSLIRPMATKTFWFMAFYSLGVGCVVVADGVGLHFSLPESVLNYLVGSTAVTVIGLVGMVVTGVFLGGKRK